MFNISEKTEHRVISFGIIAYWWLFWLFNVIDKVIGKGIPFFEGKDRMAAFVKYFSSIGINNPIVAGGTLWFVSIMEFLALVFLSIAIYYWFKKKPILARGAMFYGILTSLFVFSFFAIGDQVFGDRMELWEHTMYWTALILSWIVFTRHDMIDLKK